VADAPSLDAVRRILEKEKPDLMIRYSANGVAIGKASEQSDEYAIVVYVSSKPSNAPTSIDGIPIRFVTAGPFKAL